MAILFNAGTQLPVKLLSEVVGNGDSVPPEQIAATGLNVGVILAPTVIVKVVVVAHSPALGVNV